MKSNAPTITTIQHLDASIISIESAYLAIRGRTPSVELENGLAQSLADMKALRKAEEQRIIAVAAGMFPTSTGEAPTFSGAASRYTDEEFAKLPGDRRFETIRAMANHNANIAAGLSRGSKVHLPYAEPRFKAGDWVTSPFNPSPYQLEPRDIAWQDNTGFGHYSFWRVCVPGFSGEECCFQRFDAPVEAIA